MFWRRFYVDCLGMTILRKRDVPEEKYMNVFLGYGPEDNHFCVELTYSESSFLAHIQSSCFHMQTVIL